MKKTRTNSETTADSSFIIHHSSFRSAFTLIELMISIALVLLLMIGINQVFKVTGEAVGTSTAISTGVRDARAVQTTMTGDFAVMATEPTSTDPAGIIIIRSERVSAFRNAQDERSDRDWNRDSPTEATKRTIDINRDGNEGDVNTPGENILPAIYGPRSHRVDRMCFFARGNFPRQTGGGLDASGNLLEEYIADMSCPEAWIWYGHLKRPDDRSPVTGKQAYAHWNPGENPNPANSPPRYNEKNFYANDFLLGRMVMLLNEGVDTDMPADGVGNEIRDKNGVLQRFIRRTQQITPAPPTWSLSPLVELVQSNEPSATDRWQIQWSRYDLVNTSIKQYLTILTNWIADNPPVFPAPANAWFNQMSDWRFQGDPVPLKPLIPDNMGRTTPVFIEHCSQFIIEFAGDFITQNPDTGLIDTPATAYEPDNQIDFLIDNSTGVPTRRIRWYGMPRDVAGATNGGPDRRILGGSGVGTNINLLVDVVPLRDVLYAASVTNVPPPELFIERRFPQANQNSPPPAAYTASAGAMPFDSRYIVAWGPDTDVVSPPGTAQQPRPKMFRIVYTIDDPTGRIAEGQTFEYVFKVGG